MAKNGSTVTWFEARQCWKRRIGKRTFYLGSERYAAEAEAAAIKAQWRRLRAEGHEEWPQGQPNRLAIQTALRIGVGALPASPTADAPVVRPEPIKAPEELVAADALSVEDAANLFVAARQKNPGRAGERTLTDLRQRLSVGLEVLGRKTALNSLRQSELDAFAGHWLRKAREGKCSKVYAKNIVAAAKSLLVWCSESDEIRWTKPSRFDSIMLVPIDKPQTEADMERLKAQAWGEDERHFKIAQLRTLYRQGSDRLKAALLLGLNCGYSPIEMERLKETDIKKGVVQTVRGKTLVPSQHALWPETLAALKRADWFNNAKAGRTLSSEFKVTRRAHCPKAPPMKFLRHTSGNEVKKIAGGEISEVHLAHTEGLKMQGPYTDRLWDQHAEALLKLRKVFAPVWAA